MRNRRPPIAVLLPAAGLVAAGALALTVAGCAAQAGSPVPSPSPRPATATATTAVSPTAAHGPSASPASSAASGLGIAYEEQAQFELVAPSGRHVYIDIYDETLLLRKPTASDVLLTTVLFPHHYDQGFEASFPGRKLVAKAGRIKLDDMTITSIDAASADIPIVAGNASDQIFVVEAGGLRVVACGDLAQQRLTPEQLAAIGRNVDVALCPIVNTAGDEDATGRKALDNIDQIHPRLLIPTHASIEGATQAAAVWPAAFTTKPVLQVTRVGLPTATTMLFLGRQAPNYGAILKLTEDAGW